MMNDRAELLMSLVERIGAVVDKPGGLDAREVASVLKELDDKDLSRSILAQFMASACIRGDVSEVVAWAVVMSHVEGKLPAKDVQMEAMHLMTQH